MIVPAAQHYFETLQVFKDAQLGDVFDIDNGLGGSHTVVFRGKTDDGRFIFHQPAREDWPEYNFRFDQSEVMNSVFVLLPQDLFFRDLNMKMINIREKQYAVDAVYGIVWVEDSEGYFKIKRKLWSIASKAESEEARKMTGISRKRK